MVGIDVEDDFLLATSGLRPRTPGTSSTCSGRLSSKPRNNLFRSKIRRKHRRKDTLGEASMKSYFVDHVFNKLLNILTNDH